MERKHCEGVRAAAVASSVACLTLLCAPALCIAADPLSSSAEIKVSPKALLAPGAGYARAGGTPACGCCSAVYGR